MALKNINMVKYIDKMDLVGNRVERLTILDECEPTYTKGGNKKRCFICECDCGIIKNFCLNDLRQNRVKSCGCYGSDTSRSRALIRNTKHGMYRTSEYNAWLSMKKRCLNVSHKHFNDYGGRGIYVCDEWKDSFESFINDMGLKPEKSYSLDRIDVNDGYKKENCRWADKKTQQRNKRNNVKVTFNGKEMTLSEVSEITGKSWHNLYYKFFISKNASYIDKTS